MGGILSKVFDRRGHLSKDTRVLMLGLDSAGKTTILCILIFVLTLLLSLRTLIVCT